MSYYSSDGQSEIIFLDFPDIFLDLTVLAFWISSTLATCCCEVFDISIDWQNKNIRTHQMDNEAISFVLFYQRVRTCSI